LYMLCIVSIFIDNFFFLMGIKLTKEFSIATSFYYDYSAHSYLILAFSLPKLDVPSHARPPFLPWAGAIR
jgi:hypothetical protein